MKNRLVAAFLFVVGSLLIGPALTGCDLGTYERRMSESPGDSSGTESTN